MSISAMIGPLLLGIATGCRSSLGVAAVSFSGRPLSPPGPIAAVQSRWGRVVSGLLVVGELVADKVPSAPSRLDGQALVPRLVLGATGAAALAWRDGNNRAVAALAGVAGAVLGSVAGLRYRTTVKQRGLPDLPAALAEDAVAVLLARSAGRARY